jgi:hypothetical protein
MQAKIELVRLFAGDKPVRAFTNWQTKIAVYVLSRAQAVV